MGGNGMSFSNSKHLSVAGTMTAPNTGMIAAPGGGALSGGSIQGGGSLPGYSLAHAGVKVSSVHGEGGTHQQLSSSLSQAAVGPKSIGYAINSGSTGSLLNSKGGPSSVSSMMQPVYSSDNSEGSKAMSNPELAVCGPTYQRPPGIQSLAVPGGIPGIRPPYSGPPRRGNTVTASKRTRFALQVINNL
jgi:hypothetical protein